MNTETMSDLFKKNRLILLVGVFALMVGFALWAVWPSGQSLPRGALPPPSIESRDIVLYFVDSEGFALVSEEQQIPGCNDERQCIAQTIEALSAGSQTLQPVLSERTRVLGVELDGDLVRIDFSRELVDRHPGGSLSELLTVYGVANTLAVNFPYLRRIQILIEGRVEPTLKGHVDISRPIRADFRYSYIPPAREQEASMPGGAGKHVVTGKNEE